MRKLCIALLMFGGIVFAFDYDSYYNSDGSYGYRSGSTTYHSDGSFTNQVGNSFYHSDGGFSNRVGNTMYNSDGSFTNQVGDSYYHSDGTFSNRVGDTIYHCQNKHKHGKQHIKQALANSCNCYFVNLALKLGKDKLYNFSKSLGFGDSITIPFPCPHPLFLM